MSSKNFNNCKIYFCNYSDPSPKIILALPEIAAVKASNALNTMLVSGTNERHYFEVVLSSFNISNPMWKQILCQQLFKFFMAPTRSDLNHKRV